MKKTTHRVSYQYVLKQKKISTMCNFEKFIVSMINAFIITLEKYTRLIEPCEKNESLFYGWFIDFNDFLVKQSSSTQT